MGSFSLDSFEQPEINSNVVATSAVIHVAPDALVREGMLGLPHFVRPGG